jgi:hypothetical protein
MLKKLDGEVKKKFGVSLVAIVHEPSTYMNEKGFAVKLSKITDYVDAETGRMLELAKGSTRSFHESAAKADELTRKVGVYISAHAIQNNIPVLRPVSAEIPLSDKNQFYINEMDASTQRFLDRLVDASTFVVDITKSYDSLKIGSWLFDAERECIVSIHSPKNSLLLMRSGRAEILGMLKEAADSVKGL